MTSTYTALVKQDGDWWIGWIEEVPGVNAQERTREELMASLREILREALDFKGLTPSKGVKRVNLRSVLRNDNGC